MKFSYLIFFFIFILGCSKPQKDEDISLFIKSYENSIQISEQRLRICFGMFEDEYGKRYKSFKEHYNKFQIISKISSRFYNKIDALNSKEKISQTEIQDLIKYYHAAFDSIKLYHTLDKEEQLITIDEGYKLKNKTSQYYKLFALILKSDLILNELKVLRNVYLEYDNGCGFTINYVHFEIESNNFSEYLLDIKLVEHIKNSEEKDVSIDSIKLNNIKIRNLTTLIKRDSANNTIKFIPNKKGCYTFFGELKVQGPTGYKLYPFK